MAVIFDEVTGEIEPERMGPQTENEEEPCSTEPCPKIHAMRSALNMLNSRAARLRAD